MRLGLIVFSFVLLAALPQPVLALNSGIFGFVPCCTQPHAHRHMQGSRRHQPATTRKTDSTPR